MIRSAVYGAGAMGTVLGAYISAGGGSTDLFTRNRTHAGALRAGGARISGHASFTVPVRAYLPEEMEGEYDIIFLFTKQGSNTETAEFLKGHLKGDGVVCTCQNGLPEDGIAAVVGKERCMGCVVSWGAEYVGPGEAALTSDIRRAEFCVGSPYGTNPREKDISDILSLMAPVKCGDGFTGVRYAKLAVNCAFSPLSALSGMTFGEIADHRRYRKIVLALLNECFAVSRSHGIRTGKLRGADIEAIFGCRGGLKKALALALVPRLMDGHRDTVSGMYRDIMAGKRTEIDYLNGVITDTAGDVPVPLNRAAVAMVREAEEGKRGTGTENLDALLGLL